MNYKSANHESVSKEAFTEWLKANPTIKTKDVAYISGCYSTGGNLMRAISSGYVNAEAMANITYYYDLPRNYFEGAHAATDGVAIVSQPKQKTADHALPYADIICLKETDALKDFYGDYGYTELVLRLVHADYERHKEEILAKKYENMTREELIKALIDREKEE